MIEMARETFRVDGCGGNDNFQVRAARQELFQIAQQKINVQAALVRLINNDGVILHQQAILLDFRQQDTVGHQLNHGVFADVVAEADFITDTATRLALQLFGNTVSDGARRQSTRLGVANQAFQAAPQLHADFG